MVIEVGQSADPPRPNSTEVVTLHLPRIPSTFSISKVTSATCSAPTLLDRDEREEDCRQVEVKHEGHRPPVNGTPWEVSLVVVHAMLRVAEENYGRVVDLKARSESARQVVARQRARHKREIEVRHSGLCLYGSRQQIFMLPEIHNCSGSKEMAEPT